MSSIAGDKVVSLADRRRKRTHAETSHKMVHAAVALLRESAFDDASICDVAGRAGVPSETASGLYSSMNELLTEVCLQRIRNVALITEATDGSISRVAAQLIRIMQMVAEEPTIAEASAAVFITGGPAVHRGHKRIGVELRRLITSAVGPGSWPEVITTLELLFSGALIQAAAGAMTYQQAADRVETAVSLILEGFDHV